MSEIDDLRARLAGLTGPARTGTLIELGQKVADRYWRTGPGKPEAQPDLDEAAGLFDEAYGYFREDDGMRRHVAALRGLMYGIRHLAHFGPAADRKLGMEMLEEAVPAPNLPPMQVALCRMTLGQLYMSEVTRAMQSADIGMKLTSGGFPASAVDDLDRAAACFEQVRSAPAAVGEMHQAATLLLRTNGALRTIVSARPGGSSAETMNRIMEAVGVLQEIHREQSADGGTILYKAEYYAGRPVLDRPVALVEVDDDQAGPAPSRRQPDAPAPADPAALRRALRARVAAGGDLFEALETLLAPRASAPPAGLVDDVVEIATALADGGTATATDQLLLAAGLVLRACAPGARWVRQDLDEATAALLEAAASPRPAPPETVRVLDRLASMIDSADPACRAASRLSDVRGRR